MERDMNQSVQVWMPAILALFGSLIVVVITAWLNTKTLSAQIEAMRAEMKQHIAEAELRITKEIIEVRARVERLEEQRGRSRMVKIFKCAERSRSSMMDVEDDHNHMRAAFGLRDRIGQPGTPARE